MAEASVSAVDEDEKVDEAIRKMFEIAPFIWNKKDELETNKPEVASNVDKRFQINLLGKFYSKWGREVFVEDYTSTDGRINEDPGCCPPAFEVTTKYLHHKSGQRIKLQIHNLPEDEECFNKDNFVQPSFKDCDGAILFCGPLDMDIIEIKFFNYKIREASPTTIPILLVVNNALEPPIKWIGQGLEMASTEEMDNFCREIGFFAWFEICERDAGEESDFGRAVSKLVDEIISMNQKTNKPKGLKKPKGFRSIFSSSKKQTMPSPVVASNLENASAEEQLALHIACYGADKSTLSEKVFFTRPYTLQRGEKIQYIIYRKYLNKKSSKEIKLYIWNQYKNAYRKFPWDVRGFRDIDGAIVFWRVNSDSIDTVLEYKNEIRRSFPTAPILLLIDNVLKQPVEWIGQGLLMNSTEEMDNFCLEHGFFTWFEMLERGDGEESDFGRAMSKLVDEIIAMKF